MRCNRDCLPLSCKRIGGLRWFFAGRVCGDQWVACGIVGSERGRLFRQAGEHRGSHLPRRRAGDQGADLRQRAVHLDFRLCADHGRRAGRGRDDVVVRAQHVYLFADVAARHRQTGNATRQEGRCQPVRGSDRFRAALRDPEMELGGGKGFDRAANRRRAGNPRRNPGRHHRCRRVSAADYLAGEKGGSQGACRSRKYRHRISGLMHRDHQEVCSGKPPGGERFSARLSGRRSANAE